MKNKIFICVALIAAMSLSVSAIDVYNHSFDSPFPPTNNFPTFGTFPPQTVTQGWWYVDTAGLSITNGLFTVSPVDGFGQVAYVGWLTAANNDIRQDIPGPTYNGDGNTAPGYSTTEFTSGTTYTISWSYKAQYENGAVAVSNNVFMRNRDSGQGEYNAYILDTNVGPITNGFWFYSQNADFTSIGRTNRVVLRGVGPSGNAVIFDNVTIEEASEMNLGFEIGSFHGWTASGNCWNGAPLNYDGTVAIGGWDGTYYACSRACVGATAEQQTGTLQSKSFTLPSLGEIQFLAGGYSHLGIGPGTDWNYVTLKDAVNGAELDRAYMPGTTVTMIATNLVPPLAYQGSGSNMYIEVIDNCTSNGWAWLAVDKFEIIVIPEPVIFGLLAILGLAILRRK